MSISEKSLEDKIERYTAKIEKLKETKKKYEDKTANVTAELEEYEEKLKMLKADEVIRSCEEYNFSAKDYLKLSKAIKDGSIPTFLKIEPDNKNEEQTKTEEAE